MTFAIMFVGYSPSMTFMKFNQKFIIKIIFKR